MRNVKRSEEPQSLKKHGSDWTRELLDKVDECEKTEDGVPAKLYDKYNRADVKNALEKMYHGRCCYCEGRIGVVAYGNIEHRKPKSKYPSETYNWANLHLACPKCNSKKGNKYSDADPILDACTDTPIQKHLTYRAASVVSHTKRGTTTIKHVDLNRRELLDVRIRVLLSTIELIDTIKENPGASETDHFRETLSGLCDDEFGSLVEHTMQNFFNDQSDF